MRNQRRAREHSRSLIGIVGHLDWPVTYKAVGERHHLGREPRRHTIRGSMRPGAVVNTVAMAPNSQLAT